MNKNILTTQNLTKTFRNETVVKDLSIAIPEGTVYGLLGPNGAGKSTTLKMLVGLLTPSAGSIQFDGEPWSRKQLNDIGFLIEQPPIYGNLTAVENLSIHATLLKLSKRRIQEVLEIAGLTNTGKKKAANFSTGMKQRLGIAIAILNNPRLLILDEPTNGLDPVGIQDLRNLIREFPDMGMTVILSSHMLSEVELIADEIGIISSGRLGYQGPLCKAGNLEQLFLKTVQQNRDMAGGVK